MLVLTRKAGQSILISGRITRTVTRIAGNRVALAVDAPQNVHIRRGELAAFDGRSDDELDKPPDLSFSLDKTIAERE
jgi:carbon storage regulator CsrA